MAKKPIEDGDLTGQIAANLRAKFKGASIRKLADGADSALKEVIPTGIAVLDNWVLGVGGLPVGRIVEMYGDLSSGKTSLAFQSLAGAQRAGGLAILCETESTLMPERGPVFGMDPQKVLLLEPPSMNDLLEQLRSLIEAIPKGVGPNLIAWDSLAASPTAASWEGEARVGEKARMMSDQLPVITKMLIAKRTAFLVLNQTREKIGIKFGDPTTTPGGNAPKFFASIRLQLWRGKTVKEREVAVGQHVTIKASKNKVAMPLRKASLKLDFRTGWDDQWSTFDFAKTEELIDEGKRLTDESYLEATKALETFDGWHHGV
jgi:recombination protein RecA